jgi:glutathione peroxidase
MIAKNTLRTAFAAAFTLVAMTAFAANLYDIPVKDIDGKDTTLASYKGDVMLIVNVASKCGNTPQYAALEDLYTKHKGEGFVVLGFPCNQFGSQEPGTNAQIKEFCTSTYAVDFPMFDKIDVNGEHRHPLYTALAGKDSPFPGDIGWNFAKFLISRDGKIIKRFAPGLKPDTAEVTSAIESAIAQK